ncbi:hypothetical protein V1477_000993 [Vespula maculifrons]|uniref:Secreted protein n=1 Tax=Vespula maculifrons TaxID=7453 RepID=A0ABD2D0I1_VESMC
MKVPSSSRMYELMILFIMSIIKSCRDPSILPRTALNIACCRINCPEILKPCCVGLGDTIGYQLQITRYQLPVIPPLSLNLWFKAQP